MGSRSGQRRPGLEPSGLCNEPARGHHFGGRFSLLSLAFAFYRVEVGIIRS